MPEDLRTLQRWFAALVRHPTSAAEASQQLPARGLVAPGQVGRGVVVRGSDVVRGSVRLDPLGCVQVYTRAYALRLHAAIAEDFPGVRALLGEAIFDDLLHRYVAARPSRHPNLIFAGRDLPRFMVGSGLPQCELAVDVARVEWAKTEAFHAPEFTPADLSHVATLAAGAEQRLRLGPNPSLRLLRVEYPVVEFLDALRDGAALSAPPRRPTWVAVYRHADAVFGIAVPEWVHDSLRALAAGRTLAEALTGADPAAVGEWFQRWAAHGLFRDVVLAGAT